MLAAIVMDEPAPLSSHVPNVDRELEAIVHRALQKSPEARFSTADEMRHALTSWLGARTQQGHSQPPPAHSGPVHSPRPELIVSTDPTLRSRSTAPPEPTSKVVYLVLGAVAALFVLAAAGVAIFVAVRVKDTVQEGATTTNATAVASSAPTPAVSVSAKPAATLSAKPPAATATPKVLPKKPDAGAPRVKSAGY